MIDDFESQESRPSGELWSEICSSLPDVQETGPGEEAQFTDSFQPSSPNGIQPNGQSNGQSNAQSNSKWEPMEDSDIYIASLENRLKRLKGQSSEVTSREMLRSLSQAKKECWDRFLHDAQTSELFQASEMDDSALEHLKRWLIPEKVAISAEELEYLLLPTHRRDAATPEPNSETAPETDPSQVRAQEQGKGGERPAHKEEDDDGNESPTPEK